MKDYRKIILSTLLIPLSFTLFAQEETCDNGIDDDGDELIDCFDNDCSEDVACDNFFFGNNIDCVDEVDVQSFSIRQQWGSANRTATSHASPAIGDLDQNGIPEVVTINNYGDAVYILNGQSGATLFTKDVGFDPENTPVIANVNGGDNAEILITENEGDDMKLYDNELNELWAEKASQFDMGMAGVADFNEDGMSEIYYKNEIRNAADGELLIQGNGSWDTDYVHGPIAVDILDNRDSDCLALGGNCDGLELITGNHIWAINITNTEGTSGNSMVMVKNMNDHLQNQGVTDDYYPKYWGGWLDGTRSCVSVADYNLDGSIDVLLSGALGSSGTDETTIFFWDVANEVVTMFTDPENFERGPGRISIADVDGDGFLNANFVNDQKLYSLDENLNIHWVHPIREGSSGFTGCTLFDFDGDGNVETVYRSEEAVLIIDGVGNGDHTTFERNVLPCISRTHEEYPVVADVDGDGESEICVACYFNDAIDFDPYDNTEFGHIRVYESDGEAWTSARSVWNQHGYFNVNIHDDLTVPIEMQNHSVAFSTSVCKYSDGSTIPFPSRPLNTFMAQVPVFNPSGCMQFVSPDIVLLGNDISAAAASCPGAEITVTFSMANEGDTDISGTLPVSYYAGNPTTSTATYLQTEFVQLLQFGVGDELVVAHDINGLGGDYTLFVVANDFGSAPPVVGTLSDLPNGPIPECETSNNYNSVEVTFTPFNLTVEKLEDDQRCDLDKTPNGSATAYFFGSTPGNTVAFWLENFEDLTNGDRSDAGETAWSSNPGTESPGFYGINDNNNSKMFEASDTGTDNDVGIVTWTSERIDISNHTNISITVDVFETGNLEGQSSASSDFYELRYEIYDRTNTLSSSGPFTTNGLVYNDFSYLQGAISGLRTGVNSTDSLLVVMGRFHTTGSSESHYIDNVNVTGNQDDTPAVLTEASGFQFRWYDAFNALAHIGGTYSQIPAGTYRVVGEFPANGCISDTVSVTIDDLKRLCREDPDATCPPPPYIWIDEIPLSDCENPDGSLEAFVYTQTKEGTFPATDTNYPLDTLLSADGYSFSWRITNDVTNFIIAVGPVIQNLSDQQSYTVDVIENFSGCTSSEASTVSSGLIFPPNPTITVTNITTCVGAGALSADVNGNTTDFTFYWYNGQGTKPVPDFTGATYTVFDTGPYTVVAQSNTSSCLSNAVTGMVRDESLAPVASVTVQDNTSCTVGNGIIAADGDGAGTVIGFTFNWFKGANALPANALPSAFVEPNSFLVNDDPFVLGGLSEGTYRVVVTENATSCSDTLDVFVAEASVAVEVTGSPSVVNISSCDPSVLGSIDASGIVPGDVSSISAGNINASFEDFDILTATNFVQNFGGIRSFDQRDVPGWSTTASDGEIEIWHNDHGRGLNGLRAYQGVQFAEINANEPAALYFDLSTVPGTVFHWSFAHRGRSGTDELSVNIGGPGAEEVQGIFSTGNTAWAVYNGFYTIPNGQTTTRFQFEAVSTNNGNPSVGNFIDVVSFVLFPYRFELYQGAIASGTADFINTSGMFDDLPEGDHVLIVYDNFTGCRSTEIAIRITRDTNGPEITTILTADSNCDTGTGAVSVTSATPAGSPEPASYTYQLFDGHGFASQNGSDVNITDGAVPHLFQNLEAGDYRVNVINNDKVCDAFVDVVVNDATVTPSFSSVVQTNDNASCNPASPNGSATVSIDVFPYNSADYRFTWYEGIPSALGPQIHNAVMGQDFVDDRTDGFYSVVAEDIATGCESDTLSFEIFLLPHVPNIVIEEVAPHTNCGPDGNGSLRAYVTNDPTGVCTTGCELNEGDGFTFEWVANGTTTPILGNNSTISGLVQGQYTVTATYTSLSCSNSANFTLSEDQVFPVLTLNDTQPNTSCNSANGEALVDLSFNGNPVLSPSTQGMDFEWYSNGTLVTDGGTVSGSTTENLVGAVDDTYKVVAISPLGCASDTLTVVVAAELNRPDFTPVPIDNTVCDVAVAIGTFNGQITVNPNVGAVADYSYDWFDGAGTATPTAFTATDNALSQIPGGTYTVQVTSVANACDTTISVTIIDDLETVSVASSDVYDADVCEGAANYPNGGIDITLSGGSGTYTFEWYYGGGVNPTNLLDNTEDIFAQKGTAGTASVNVSGAATAGAATASIGGLDPGMYTVRVLDTDRGCYSLPFSYTIDQAPSGLSLDAFTDVSDISCDPGAATANGTGATGTASYEWFVGTSATGTAVANTQTATGLAGGIYTVKYTDDPTQCFVTAQITIDPFDQTLALTTTPTSQTDCSPNGEAEVTAVASTFNPVGPPRGYVGGAYDYQWYFGPGILSPMANGADPGNGSNPSGVTTANLSGLVAGDYTVVVTDRETMCTSATETVTVTDGVSANEPVLVFNPIVTPSDCNEDNGVFEVWLGSNPSGNVFHFEFYEGALDYASLRNYQDPDSLVTGEELVSKPGTPITVFAMSTASTASSDSSVVSNLISGIYTVVVTDAITGCRYQDSYDLPFIDQQIATTITVEHVGECPVGNNGVASVGIVEDMATPGIIDGEVDDISEYILFLYAGNGIPADRLAPYTFQGIRFPLQYDAGNGGIVDGDGIDYPNAGVTTPMLNTDDVAEFHGLPPGPYIAVAREIPMPAFNPLLDLECWSEASFGEEILNLAHNPIIDDVVLTPNSNCGTTGNGQIEVTVAEDPAENLNPDEFRYPAGYQFTFTDAGGIPVHSQDIFNMEMATSTAADLLPGDYTVTIERAFQLTTVTYNTPTGVFDEGETVEFSGGAEGIITRDDGSEMDIYITTGGVPGAGETIMGRRSGATGTVDGIAPGPVYPNGCSVMSRTYTVGDVQEVHTVVNEPAVVHIRNCDFMPASTITIIDNDIETGGAGQPVANYTFQWFKGDISNEITSEMNVGTGPSIDMTAAVAANPALAPIADTYFVVATDANGCTTPAYEVEIMDETETPSISFDTPTVDSSCDPDDNEGNGVITFQIIDPQLNSDYAFRWLDNGGTPLVDGPVITGSSGTLNGATAAVYESAVRGIDGGTYTLEVTDMTDPNNTCAVTTTFTLNEVTTDPTVDLTATFIDVQDNENCTGPNGHIEIRAVREGAETVDLVNPDALDYTFRWFRDPLGANVEITGAAVSGLMAPDGIGNRIENLDGNTYEVEITNTATECVARSQIIVNDAQVNPIIGLDGKVENTFCDDFRDFVGDGQITIDVTEDGSPAILADYTVSWNRGSVAGTNPIFDLGPNTGATLASNADSTALTGLSAGDYTVRVVKNSAPNAGCSEVAIFNVGLNELIPTLDVSGIEVLPDTTCVASPNDPSGVIMIDDNDFGPAIDGLNDLGLYDIMIRRGSTTGDLVDRYTGLGATSITETGLPPDDYFITAEHLLTGCSVPTVRINVPNSARNPQISLVGITADQSCGTSSMTGSIGILIDGIFDHTAPRFDVQWYTGPGAVIGNEIALQTSATLSNLSTGTYSVRATNNLTACEQVADFFVHEEEVLPSVFHSVVVANTICDDDNDHLPVDNGSFELVEAIYEGAVLDQTAMTGNYTLRIYTDPALAASEITDSNPATPFIFEELGAGTYYATVARDISRCESNPTMFEIEDVLSRPIIAISIQEADSTCVPGAGIVPNGTLFGTADGGIRDTDSDYAFRWYLGSVAQYRAGTAVTMLNGINPGNGSIPTGVTTSTVSRLAADTYTLEVTRLSTGCISVGEFEIPNAPIDVEILDIETEAATTCVPSNGRISVTSVSRDNLADYTFEYYDVDPTIGTPTPVFTGSRGVPFMDVHVGTYFVVGTNTILNCRTLPFEARIGENVVYPEIVLDSFDLQTNCDPSNPNGGFETVVYETDEATGRVTVVTPEAPDYSVQWFSGTSTLPGNILPGETANTILNIPARSFTVEVTDARTGCMSAETFEMVDDINNPVAISTSSSENTNCVDPDNGQMVASVAFLAPGKSIADYNFYWYVGDVRTIDPISDDPLNPSPAPAFTGSLVTNVAGGVYTVFVADVVDPFCRSNSTLVEVVDGTQPPVYTLTTEDVTVCFDVKDGFARVEVPDFSRVNIEWLDEDDNLIENMNQKFADSLNAGSYRLRLTDVNNGCVAREIFNINNPGIPPTPMVVLNSDRTNCAEPNASAVANVSGVRADFLFEWFATDDFSTPYATGAEVFNLDSTTYAVRATNLSTGCESPPAYVTVFYDITDPVFEVQMTSSACLRTEDGAVNQFDGTAVVRFDEFNAATNYRWEDASGHVVGKSSRLVGVGPGTYTVFFTAANGCEYSEAFAMFTDVMVYNGLSPNDDGLNDFLLIDCIDFFGNNQVQIFNREGVKVYEIDNYDNANNCFKGFSNVGGSQLKLPAGTYFAVVELNDGREPMQFFLELVR